MTRSHHQTRTFATCTTPAAVPNGHQIAGAHTHLQGPVSNQDCLSTRQYLPRFLSSPFVQQATYATLFAPTTSFCFASTSSHQLTQIHLHPSYAATYLDSTRANTREALQKLSHAATSGHPASRKNVFRSGQGPELPRRSRPRGEIT